MATIAVSVTNSTTISIANGAGTGTVLSFDTEVQDDGAVFDSGTPTRLTVPGGQSGWFVVAGFVHWAANSTGSRWLFLRDNVGTILAEHNIASTTGHNDPALKVATLVYLEEGQYVELYAEQTSGGSLNVQAFPRFGMVRVE